MSSCFFHFFKTLIFQVVSGVHTLLFLQKTRWCFHMYMSITIFEYMNQPWPLIMNTFILQYQYHQHWNSFFHFTILCLLELSEDIPFSNVTRIHWLCVGHAIFLNSISQICCNPLVVATQHLISWSGCLREQEVNHL